jgi:tetratricopeptide (TPR) repeat protein
MKRRALLGLWCLIPLVVLAYHFGPGQEHLRRDRAAALRAEALQAEEAEDWKAAIAAYSAALEALPQGNLVAAWQLRLARAKARINTGELPEAMIDMEAILGEMTRGGAPRDLVEQTRAETASAQYYLAWLMRLEGATPEEWTPEVEKARQHYRLLAESAGARGQEFEERVRNLEAVIRLARMDLSELQALPLPKPCQGCKNASQKCRSQRQSQARQAGEDSKEPRDAREVSAGKRPDGTGS